MTRTDWDEINTLVGFESYGAKAGEKVIVNGVEYLSPEAVTKAIMAAKAEERQNCINVVLGFIKYGGDTHHGITINGKVEAMEVAAAIRNKDTV